MRSKLFFSVLVGTLLVVVWGCGKDTSPKGLLAQYNKSNIQRLANLYNRYQAEHRWVGPPDEETFRKYVKALPAARLEMLGVDPNDIDGLFRSERDGENFVFRYRVVGSAMGSVDPVVFEATGVGGKRLVGFTGRPPQEVEAQDYNDWLEGKYVPETAADRDDIGFPATGAN